MKLRKRRRQMFELFIELLLYLSELLGLQGIEIDYGEDESVVECDLSSRMRRAYFVLVFQTFWCVIDRFGRGRCRSRKLIARLDAPPWSRFVNIMTWGC